MYPINCVKQKCPRNKKKTNTRWACTQLLDNNFYKKEKKVKQFC